VKTFTALVISCPERAALRAQTLASLAATDFDGPVHLVIDDEPEECQKLQRIDRTWVKALQVASDQRVDDFVLMFEDDVVFNRFLRFNLERWSPLQGARASLPFWGSLYHPDHAAFRPRLETPPGADYHVILDPADCWGGQGIVISPSLAGWIINAWPGNAGPHDRVVPWLASHMCRELYLHRPSLVEHVGHLSAVGSIPHQAVNFDRDWRAE
jgi:hypothetical protein